VDTDIGDGTKEDRDAIDVQEDQTRVGAVLGTGGQATVTLDYRHGVKVAVKHVSRRCGWVEICFHVKFGMNHIDLYANWR